MLKQIHLSDPFNIQQLEDIKVQFLKNYDHNTSISKLACQSSPANFRIEKNYEGNISTRASNIHVKLEFLQLPILYVTAELLQLPILQQETYRLNFRDSENSISLIIFRESESSISLIICAS